MANEHLQQLDPSVAQQGTKSNAIPRLEPSDPLNKSLTP
jgi:hypothetical protein